MADTRPYIGGQAVLEGVMMRAPGCVTVAVRRPDGTIAVRETPFKSKLARSPLLKLPFVRGVATLGESLSIGMRALRFSAEQQVPPDQQGEPEESSYVAKWMTVVRYVDAGYIKDDDAKTWNADELLKNLKDGTEEQNEERRSRGIPEMEVVGWVQPPAYDGTTQRLAWSAATKGKNAQPGAGQGVNYNTYVLGREGCVMQEEPLVVGRDEQPPREQAAGDHDQPDVETDDVADAEQRR